MLLPDMISTSFLLLVAVALVHATFQLGVSVLTLLSGHSLGAKKAHRRVLSLNGSYLFGSLAMTLLILLSMVYIHGIIVTAFNVRIFWSVAGIIAALSGLLLLLAYYRKGKGTLLWIPRFMANYLTKRAKKTRSGIEAFALGATTVVAELPFSYAPFIIAALIISPQGEGAQLLYSAGYTLVTVLPLLVIIAMIGAGQRLSTIQKWRESQKSFLQYAAGIGLILIACYITAFYLMEGI